MHGRYGLAALGMLLLGGCAEPAKPVAVPAPASPAVEAPASSAGGACRLLDFAVINEATGNQFNVAAATRRGHTHTCVVRTTDTPTPDLVLAVSDVEFDLVTFKSDLVPKSSHPVSGLGKAAYQVTTAAKGKQGATAEVGWLTKDGVVSSLRYTLPAGEDPATVEALVPKLVELAKKIKSSDI